MTFDAEPFVGGIDLSRFDRGNLLLPGVYRVDIVVNQRWQRRQDVRFEDAAGAGGAQPCFDAALLTSLGVDLAKAARGDGRGATPQPFPEQELCVGDLGAYIPDATVTFDDGKQRLLLSVPQLYMAQNARGYVDPSQWDAGVTSAVLGYNASYARSSGSYSGSHGFLGLNAGVNLGAWHLRHNGSQSWRDGDARPYQNTATYLQRDVPALRAQFVLGETFTSGQVADSVRLRGATLASDLRMYPQSQRGYAPVVRGVAESNARVTIRQNGYVLYETVVAPGPFEINDLLPTGYGGDLAVTVTEADGRENTFLVPYSAVPQLLRPGLSLFSLAAGQLDDVALRGSDPWVMQGSWQRGLTNTFTGFGSVTASDGYAQLRLGTAVNTPLGALSFDVASSNTQVSGHDSWDGYSLGVTYSKNLVQSGTNFALGAYRLSSSGYLGLNDAVRLRERAERGEVVDLVRPRSRLNLSLSQRLGPGSLFLTGSTNDYWGGNLGRQTTYSLGYSSRFKSVHWSLTAQRTRVYDGDGVDDDFFNAPGLSLSGGRTDDRVLLNISMPLGTSRRAPSATALLARDTGGGGGTDLQLGIAGVAGPDDRLTYGASVNHRAGDRDDYSAINANLGYQAGYANLNVGVSDNDDQRQYTASASGGIVAHAGGVHLAPQLGDTIGLVEAPGARGARVSTGRVRVGRDGYAVVPYLTPYQLNTVSLDPKGMSEAVELKDSLRTVAPRLGAVVKLNYETVNGRAVVIKARRANGESLPFGAEVRDAQGQPVGAVGQASRIFVRGVDDQGALSVHWGDGPDDQCRLNYQLPPLAEQPGATATALVAGAQCSGAESLVAAPSSADRLDPAVEERAD